MAKQYISLQGKLYLSPIVAGVAAAARHVGNAPDYEIELDGDVIEHQESTTGQRTTDFMMTRTRSVKFKGTLEEASKENIAYILNFLSCLYGSEQALKKEAMVKMFLSCLYGSERDC